MTELNSMPVFAMNKDTTHETPKELFNYLDHIFHFTLDAAASNTNHLCDKYFTEENDGLSKPWNNHVVWCNPPYSRKDTPLWTKKFKDEYYNTNSVIVALLFNKSDTKWFRENIYKHAHIVYINGRLKFGNSENSAPFPSILAIYGDKRFPHNETSMIDIIRKKGKEDEYSWDII